MRKISVHKVQLESTVNCSLHVLIFYKNDKIHRKNGPAKIWTDGYEEWWVNDIFIKSGNAFNE